MTSILVLGTMHNVVLFTIAASVALGALGQMIASVSRLPAIIFLLILGILAGPDMLGVVQPESLGGGLSIIVSAFVAIILFEGGLTLKPTVLREALGPVRRLITVGAALALLGGAVAAHYVTQMPWSTAFLFSSLIVVTGPTVISPILRRARLEPRLHAVMKSESILIDPIGAIIAIVVLQYVVDLMTKGSDWSEALVGFFGRACVGVLVGGLVGAVAALLARVRFFHRHENEHLVGLGALSLALSAFAVSEYYYSESGITAATVAGLVLAAVPLPFREELEKFKEDLTRLGVSVLFILLAANMDLDVLRETGLREVLLVAGIMFVVRPFSVFVSTVATGLKLREKLYLSLVAPRGIVAAAMASHFADHLKDRDPDAAVLIQSLVFLTIAVTVIVEGGWAVPLAKLLHVHAKRPKGILVVGVNSWSLVFAEALRARRCAVLLTDNNQTKCEMARQLNFEVFQVDATHGHTFEDLDLSRVGRMIAMTPNDAINTLVCEAGKPWFGEKHVFQVLSKPSGVRTAGHCAMPTGLSHAEVCFLLQEGKLKLATGVPTTSNSLGHDLTTTKGSMIPMLVIHGDDFRFALDGETCGAQTTVMGLVESQPQEELSRELAVEVV